MSGTVIVVLAGGKGTRFGGSKQLAHFNGVPMLRHVTQICVESGAKTVVICLGSQSDATRVALKGIEVRITETPNWKEGMSETLKSGVRYVHSNLPFADSILVTLGDQPYVTSAHLDELIAFHLNDGDNIVATEYDSVVGVPALFPRSYWSDLLKVEGDIGARTIIRDRKDVIRVTFSPAGLDVDRPGDLPH